MYLFISTSRGVYKYDLKKDLITKIIGNWEKGFFKKPSKGFFGICSNETQNEIIFASRENLSKYINYEKSTDTIIYFYNFKKKEIIKKIVVYNLLDVHQISYFNNFIFITETGSNRIQVLNAENNSIQYFIDIGKSRNDINHINAINIDINFLYIGLNNGHKKNKFKNAQIIKIPTQDLYNLKSFDALDYYKIINLKNVFHTHDIEKFKEDYLISSSSLGKIYSYNQKKFIIDIKPWTRGIAINSKYIFIGKSGIGKRKSRHSRYYDGQVNVLDTINFKTIKQITIPKIGQLNDIVFIDD